MMEYHPFCSRMTQLLQQLSAFSSTISDSGKIRFHKDCCDLSGCRLASGKCILRLQSVIGFLILPDTMFIGIALGLGGLVCGNASWLINGGVGKAFVLWFVCFLLFSIYLGSSVSFSVGKLNWTLFWSYCGSFFFVVVLTMAILMSQFQFWFILLSFISILKDVTVLSILASLSFGLNPADKLLYI